MKAIIAIRGKQNSGKTTTLCLVKDKLLKDGFSLVKTLHTSSEFIGVLRKDNDLIGINTIGDHVYYLKENVTNLRKERCDVILTACRSRGATVDFLESLSCQLENKTYSQSVKDRNAINTKDANNIIRLLLESLS